MVNIEYVRCEKCKEILRVKEGEGGCIYCGKDLAGSDRVTETIWREAHKSSFGGVGQFFKHATPKPSTQTTFVK